MSSVQAIGVPPWLGCAWFSGCTSVHATFSLTERGETRGEPEPSQRTVPTERSRLGKRDVHNNGLVPSARAYVRKGAQKVNIVIVD